jgi:hypothetical protein
MFRSCRPAPRSQYPKSVLEQLRLVASTDVLIDCLRGGGALPNTPAGVTVPRRGNGDPASLPCSIVSHSRLRTKNISNEDFCAADLARVLVEYL